MLEDLSAHILDIAQNSVAAESTCVSVTVRKSAGSIEFEIADDGRGMNAQQAKAALDPFCTSRKTRRVGMGLPFLKQNAELCEGFFKLDSLPGSGTKVRAEFLLNSIDTPPLGDLSATILLLLVDAPQIHWLFRYQTDSSAQTFELDSQDLDDTLGGLDSLRIPDVALGLQEWIRSSIAEID